MGMLDTMDDSQVEIIAFRPDRAGEGVEGVLVARDITSSEYTTDDIPVLTLRDEAGVFRGVRGYHSVLRNEIERNDLQTGDTVAIKYLGKKPTKDGKKTFHAYKVAVKRAAEVAADDDVPSWATRG